MRFAIRYGFVSEEVFVNSSIVLILKNTHTQFSGQAMGVISDDFELVNNQSLAEHDMLKIQKMVINPYLFKE